jgi:DNA-binding SARP family transcriptional activator
VDGRSGARVLCLSFEGRPMDLRLFGPKEVWHAGSPLKLGGHKQRAVLALLARRANSVVSLEQLVDAV